MPAPPGAVEVDMGQGRGLVGIAAEHRYISVEWVEGSAFADRFTGSAAANGFRGLGGNDMFVATPGRDWYFGDAGYDTVSYAGAPRRGRGGHGPGAGAARDRRGASLHLGGMGRGLGLCRPLHRLCRRQRVSRPGRQRHVRGHSRPRLVFRRRGL
ncbi:hypothetical protein ACFOHS_22980 [Jhaorihella thermophila]